MIERLPIGKTTCDYLEAEEFYRLANGWLGSNKFTHVVTLNPEMVMEAEKNISFREALNRADIRIPDGSGLIWARWYLRSSYWNLLPSLFGFLRRPAQRITGVDALFELSRLAHAHHKTVYLLGGTMGQAESTKKLLEKKLPGIVVFV
ncbi:MAG: WecB/TagA/CpsF family glycosyltransferase, partial [Candidatus Andersenbacteria bacterium]|nr:WecB/TagA/CpsF family glycosyltransferase [Candidatus Andersenbacteria bacterium]